jgi:hypothetical protein
MAGEQAKGFPMSARHVADASPSVAAAAENGPHGGWSTFDCKLEGARFHLLHEGVAASEFDAVEAERLAGELESLAQSYGYGTADSYLAAADGLSDDEIAENPHLAVMKQNLFEEDGEEDAYFVEVRTSERLLFAAAATPQAKSFLGADGHDEDWSGAGGTLYDRMKTGFLRGRDMRRSQSFEAPKP